MGLTAEARGSGVRVRDFCRRHWLLSGMLLLWGLGFLLLALPVRLPMAPPGTPAPGEWVGPVHVHTNGSGDGSGTADEVAEAAARQGLDFVLVADHNSNRSDAEVRKGVLLAIAEEASTRPGHLVVLGAGNDWRDSDDPRAGDMEYAVPRARAGGEAGLRRPGGTLIFVAHPSGPNTWDDPDFHDYDGLEIWNADSEWRMGDGVLDWLHAVYGLRVPSEAMVHLLDRPDEALAWFDSVSTERPLAALCSVDAHARINVTRSWFIPFPSYSQMFALARMHVLVGRPRSGDPGADALALFDALGDGRAYCAFDVLADGSGVTLTVNSGGREVGMGASIPWSPGATLRAGLPPAGELAKIDLVRNGAIVATARGRDPAFDLDRPGVYRVEVSLPTPGLRRGWVPWLFTNPVYVPAPHEKPTAPSLEG